MPTEQCVFLILYIHGILYMYITKYSCILYVAMDLIPILLGSLPLAHNAQHSLVVHTPYVIVNKNVQCTNVRCVVRVSLQPFCIVEVFRRL